MSRNKLKHSAVLVAGVVALAALSMAAVTASNAARVDGSAHVLQVDEDDNDSGGRGYLGVSVQRLRKSLREAFDIPGDVRGLVVTNVHDDTPADEAGLRNQDVILKFNGRPMDDEDEFTEAVRAIEPGNTATLQIWRDGNTRDVTYTAGKRPRTWSFNWNSDDESPRAFVVPRTPRAPRAPGAPAAPMAPGFPHLESFGHMGTGGRLGVEIRDLNEDIAEYFGARDDDGALIWKVNEDSPAKKAGLRAGDVIVEVEGESIRNTGDLRETLAEHDPGETVAVSYIRRGTTGTARVELGEATGPGILMFSDGAGRARGLERLEGLRGARRGLDGSMDGLRREMENLQRELDQMRRELDRLKD